jgi:hypothetical protein
MNAVMTVTGSYERCNDTSASRRYVDFLAQLRDDQLLKKDF